MSKGTWPAIVGCILTLVGLGAIVTWAESRLPRALREDAAGVREALVEGQAEVAGVAAAVEKTLTQHGDLLGVTAREEGWKDAIQLATRDIEQALSRYDAEAAPILARNAREEEEALVDLLDELHATRLKATRAAAALGKRVTELGQIIDQAAKRHTEVGRELAGLEALATSTKELLERARSKHPALGKLCDDQRWVESCDGALSVRAALHQEHGALTERLRKGTQEAAKEVLTALADLEARRGRAQTPLASLRQRVEGLVDFLDKKQVYVARAQEDARAIAQLPSRPAEERAERAARDYPWNATEIRRRAGFVVYVKRTAEQLAAQVAQAADLPLERVDPQALYAQSNRLSKLRADAPAQLRALEAQLEQLDVLHEQVLVDMEIKEGLDVTFHQELLDLRADRTLAPKATRTWTKVSEADYKRLEPYLGMSILGKPLGYFDDQARKVTHAAGFPYVGVPAYGTWRGEPHGVWEFRPEARGLQEVFWGKCYEPVEAAQHDAFAHAAASPVWLGSDRFGHALYGSAGSLTRKIYATSKYVLNDGWKNTRYKRSGGTFRGTRYERPPPSRSTVVVGGYTSSGGRSSSSGPRYTGSSSGSRSSSSGSRSSSSSGYRGK